MNNRDSLRTQIIEAMNNYNGNRNEGLFDNAVMPVLDAAMKAGELLVHRATVPQKPVADAIVAWMEDVVAIIATLHEKEAIVSKRNLLNRFYELGESASRALADARTCNEFNKPDTTSLAVGSLLAGKTSPEKG